MLAVAFLFFPSYVGSLFGTGNDAIVTENMNRAVFQIEGMTCEGCAATVAQAIRRVPDVMAVEVSYEKGQAVVGVKPDNPIPNEEILAALKKAGYSGEILRAVRRAETTGQMVTTAEPAARTNDDEQSNHFSNEALLQTELKIEGMTCEGCATVASEAIRSVTGVQVDFQSGRANVQGPACCTFPKDAVLSALEKAGFKGEVNEKKTPFSTSDTKQ